MPRLGNSFCGACGEVPRDCTCPNGASKNYRHTLLTWLRHPETRPWEWTAEDIEETKAELGIVG